MISRWRQISPTAVSFGGAFPVFPAGVTVGGLIWADFSRINSRENQSEAVAGLNGLCGADRGYEPVRPLDRLADGGRHGGKRLGGVEFVPARDILYLRGPCLHLSVCEQPLARSAHEGQIDFCVRHYHLEVYKVVRPSAARLARAV